jgi:hypothetical protein
MIMGIIAWEGIERTKADEAYDVLKEKLPKYGMAMEVNNDYVMGSFINDKKDFTLNSTIQTKQIKKKSKL